jgi:hypothetical protein
MLKHPEDFSPRRDIVVESYDDEGNPVDLRFHMAGLMKGGLTLEQAHKKALRHREIGRKIARQDNPGELVIQTGGSRKVIPAPPPPGTGSRRTYRGRSVASRLRERIHGGIVPRI